MANYHGKESEVKFAGTTLFDSASGSSGSSWGMETSNQVVDNTGMGSSGGNWGTQVDGLVDSAATAEGAAATGEDYLTLLGSSGSLQMLTSANLGFSVGSIMNTFTESVEVTGIGRISFGWEQNDAAGVIHGAL